MYLYSPIIYGNSKHPQDYGRSGSAALPASVIEYSTAFLILPDRGKFSGYIFTLTPGPLDGIEIIIKKILIN
jgi:hypothetical protein